MVDSRNVTFRTILRASSIMGGASVISILNGLLRMKVAAMLLGPTGVGLIGIFQSLVATASSLAGLGFQMSGTRQITLARAAGETRELAAARRALFWGTFFLAVTAAMIFFALRQHLAEIFLGNPLKSTELGWLALGVIFTVGASSQTAVLTGFRHIGDLGKITVISSTVSAILTVIVLAVWREGGIVFFVISTPLANYLLGLWYLRKVGSIREVRTPLSSLSGQWRMLIGVGFMVMLSGLAISLSHLGVRTTIQDNLGLNAVGLFTSASLISLHYINFLLSATSFDFYPRLAASIEDKSAANGLINNQIEAVLLISAPVFLLTMSVATFLIDLLYTAEFRVAADIMRWMVLGDILKIAAHPLGFVFVSDSASRTFFFLKLIEGGAFFVAVNIFLPHFGVASAGIGYFITFAILFPVSYFLTWKKTGLVFRPRTVLFLIGLLSAAAILFAITSRYETWGWVVGVTMTAAVAAYSVLNIGRGFRGAGQAAASVAETPMER